MSGVRPDASYIVRKQSKASKILLLSFVPTGTLALQVGLCATAQRVRVERRKPEFTVAVPELVILTFEAAGAARVRTNGKKYPFPNTPANSPDVRCWQFGLLRTKRSEGSGGTGPFRPETKHSRHYGRRHRLV